MRVLILEPHASGHHANYLRWLAQAARSRHWSVAVATTEDALAQPELVAIATEFADLEIHPIREASLVVGAAAGSLQLMRREFGYRQFFKRAVREIDARSPVDYIILPYVDYCFYTLALIGVPFQGIPWCAISMRLALSDSQTAAPRAIPWKWRMAKRLLASQSLKALFVINPSVCEVPPQWYSPREKSKLRYLPDPAECAIMDPAREFRAALGVSSEDVAILVFGSIDERKGVDALLAAVSGNDDLGKYVVILAGRQSADLRRQLSSRDCAALLAQKRIIVLDRYVSDTELGSLLAASDVVWVGYRNHAYMSGVLVLAGKAGLPIIGSAGGEIGRLITKHGLGVAARIHRPTEVASAMRALLDAAKRNEMGRRSKMAFEGHTVENFAAMVMAAFDGHLPAAEDG
jgi:glycosyltransferase involved in cell wall biosynthesis